MPLAPETVFRRNANPVETTVGSEIVLMSLASGQCFGLGETGSDIWRLLAQPMTVPALVAELREIYEAPPGEIESDVDALLEKMRALDLVEVVLIEAGKDSALPE